MAKACTMALGLCLALLLVACDDGPAALDADGVDLVEQELPELDGELELPPIEPALCEGISPLEPTAEVTVVGEGSAASCTEAALRSALDALSAAGEGFLRFDCGGAHTITLETALQVESSKEAVLVVDGEGLISISGGGKTRIFDLDNHSNFVVQRLTLRDGFVAAGEPEVTNRPSDSGAAIRHPWFGTLKVIDVDFIDNHCASRDGEIGGGAIYAGGLTDAVISGSSFVGNSASNGGAILNRGSNLRVLRSVFQGNGALSQGDGQYGNGGGLYIDGMNYDDPGDFYMCGTVFAENTAMTHGSGVFSYFYEGSSSTIEHCLFDSNRFGEEGAGSGALYHQAVALTLRSTALLNHRSGQHAGGLFLGSGSSALIENCTFAHNEVPGNGAGIFDGASPMELRNCTFTENKADYGPAIFKGKDAVVSLQNSLMVNNRTDNEYSATSCHEALVDAGGNLQWPQLKNNGKPDVACTESIVFADPGLQPVADNGGFAPSAALVPGSPAIDAASQCPATDQRGLPRSEPCDAGAFEAQ
jgi:hypothetical protein